MLLSIQVFLGGITLRRLVNISRPFEGYYCLHLQGEAIQELTMLDLEMCKNICQMTQHNTSEDLELRQRRYGNVE